MKARVKETGEIIEVRGIYTPTIRTFGMEEIESFDMKEVETITDPDYLARLEHQYAGMAMQGILACDEWKISPREGGSFAGEVALQAHELAHALILKLKEKEADR